MKRKKIFIGGILLAAILIVFCAGWFRSRPYEQQAVFIQEDKDAMNPYLVFETRDNVLRVYLAESKWDYRNPWKQHSEAIDLMVYLQSFGVDPEEQIPVVYCYVWSLTVKKTVKCFAVAQEPLEKYETFPVTARYEIHTEDGITYYINQFEGEESELESFFSEKQWVAISL